MIYPRAYRRHIISFTVLLLLVRVFEGRSFAQSADARLNELKAKYLWGSIYLTYVPISSLTNLLANSANYQEVSKRAGESVLSILLDFLKTHKRPRINEAIAFVEIDLNRKEAGFKWANDNDGVISQIPWTAQQVVQVADLCDKWLSGSLSHTQNTSASPPSILRIFQEVIKPGMEAAHELVESAYVKAFRGANWKSYYFAMSAISGPAESWFISGFDSFDAWEKDNERLSRAPLLTSELNRIDQQDAQFRLGQHSVIAQYLEELSYRPDIAIQQQRYMTVKAVRVRPDQYSDFEEARRIVRTAYEKANIDEHWLVYRAIAGEADGTYFIFFPMKSLNQADANRDVYGKAYEHTLDEHNARRLQALASGITLNAETHIYAFNPRLSYVSAEFVKADPGFWTPRKPAPTAAKRVLPRKQEP